MKYIYHRPRVFTNKMANVRTTVAVNDVAWTFHRVKQRFFPTIETLDIGHLRYNKHMPLNYNLYLNHAINFCILYRFCICVF